MSYFLLHLAHISIEKCQQKYNSLHVVHTAAANQLKKICNNYPGIQLAIHNYM